MNLYQIVTSKKYRKKTEGIVQALIKRNNRFLSIKKFAMEHRGWPEKEAEMLAGQMTGTIRTQFPGAAG